MRQDPVLARTKLTGEPWDLGMGGYQVGAFPAGWAEWNDRFRNTVRGFWRGDHGLIPEMATRLTGSSDLFGHDGRRPQASLNFVTAHDGFTLRDLVSYNHKHNENNKEDNRDGTNDNLSWNCGVEGETDDPGIKALRTQQMRNLMATLLLSQGVPMILAGDEMGRSQGGNNNAYCQDNEISWMDWSLDKEEDRAFLEFVKKLIHLRRTHGVFRRRFFFRGGYIPGAGLKDICWISPAGREMRSEDWSSPYARCFGFFLGGVTGGTTHNSISGEHDARFLILLNAHDGPVDFHLPPSSLGTRWSRVFDTARTEQDQASGYILGVGVYPLAGRSMVVLVGDRRKRTEAVRRRSVQESATSPRPNRRVEPAVEVEDAQTRQFRIRVRSTSRTKIKRKRKWNTGKP
ncbi:MAG: hypothetical protein ABT940_09840 [Alphaproteobacteria bacterium]